jgi:hypothetical protein
VRFTPVRGAIGPRTARQRTWVPAMVPWRATDEGFVHGGFLTGDFGRKARKIAERWLSEGSIDLIASDGHSRVAVLVDEVLALGVQVKDPAQGLLDFPAVIDGQPALLCWHVGEQRIEFWHTMEDGFAGRQPLP